MSYIPHILTFLTVLSPLFIPIGVSVVHALRNWSPRVPAPKLPAVSHPRRLELAAEFD